MNWEVEYKGHTICVEYGWFGGERLLVDGEIQDERTRAAGQSRLQGSIKRGDGAGEEIMVSLDGWSGVGCQIFADDEIIFSS